MKSSQRLVDHDSCRRVFIRLYSQSFILIPPTKYYTHPPPAYLRSQRLKTPRPNALSRPTCFLLTRRKRQCNFASEEIQLPPLLLLESRKGKRGGRMRGRCCCISITHCPASPQYQCATQRNWEGRRRRSRRAWPFSRSLRFRLGFRKRSRGS